MNAAPFGTLVRNLISAVAPPAAVLPDKPVRRLTARAGRTAAEFGPDLLQTDKACKAIEGS